MTDQSSEPVLTVVTANVEESREAELVDGFRRLLAAPLPDGVLRTELLRGRDGVWRVETLWRDRAALESVRTSGEPPAALELFRRVGADHAHDVYFVAAGAYPGSPD
jgi:quinol monooxygenase YgiN